MSVCRAAVLCLALAFAKSAAADPAIGTWLTPPDRKDLTSHIQIRQCGEALCARILRAFDPSGREIVTRNVGKELFWGMRPMGNGQYGDGTVLVPLLNVRADASMYISGDRLRVRACKLTTCNEFTWIRVR